MTHANLRHSLARLAFGTLALVLAMAAPGLAQERPDLQSLTDRLLADSGAPGVGIAFVDRGAISVAVAGERAKGSGVAIEPDDLWHIGSNTKSMTALLAARLVEQGTLSWDITVADVLGGEITDIHETYREATLVHLLAHRSGLPANLGMAQSMTLGGADAQRDASRDRMQYAEWILNDEPVAALGAEDQYSNAGFVIAGLMIERKAGQPYEALMAREVFGPLKLASVGWGPPGTMEAIDQPRGHSMFGMPLPPGPSADNPVAMNSAGRAHLSLRDMGRYLLAHLKGAQGQNSDYLPEEIWTKLHSPAFGGRFGLGWIVTPYGVMHGGSNTYWLVTFAIAPEQGRAVAIAANDGDIPRLRPQFFAVQEALLNGAP